MFKKISLAEGWSFVVLLVVAMPLKYLFHIPIFVKYFGWAHGVLFIAYLILLITTSIENKWTFKRIVLGFLASLLPLGPFVFHNKYLK
jgi:integral membrane protein